MRSLFISEKIHPRQTKFSLSQMPKKPGYIYLIRAVGTNRYKIGLTTRRVEERFAELNSSQSAYPLKLMAFKAVGDVYEAEKFYHKKYASRKVHNEWFEFSPNIAQPLATELKKSNAPKPLISLKTFLLALGLVLLLIQCQRAHNENSDRPLKHEKQDFQ
jgi:hypothetical protein